MYTAIEMIKIDFVSHHKIAGAIPKLARAQRYGDVLAL